MKPSRPSGVYLLILVFCGLGLWGTYLAIGSYWGVGNEAESLRFDARRGFIVIGTMGLFLGGWGGLLWNRSRQQSRRRLQEDAD